MMNTYCEAWQLPYITDMDDMQGFMATQRRADIDARLRALASTVIKKNNLGRCDKQIIKK